MLGVLLPFLIFLLQKLQLVSIFSRKLFPFLFLCFLYFFFFFHSSVKLYSKCSICLRHRFISSFVSHRNQRVLDRILLIQKTFLLLCAPDCERYLRLRHYDAFLFSTRSRNDGTFGGGGDDLIIFYKCTFKVEDECLLRCIISYCRKRA